MANISSVLEFNTQASSSQCTPSTKEDKAEIDLHQGILPFLFIDCNEEYSIKEEFIDEVVDESGDDFQQGIPPVLFIDCDEDSTIEEDSKNAKINTDTGIISLEWLFAAYCPDLLIIPEGG